MLCYGVVQNEGLSKIIAEGFAAYGYDTLYLSKNEHRRSKGKKREEVLLIAGADLGFCEFTAPDVIVFAPDCRETAFVKSGALCRAAVIPGERSIQIAGLLKAECAVSYGMSRKDTLTLSSVDGKTVVLSLQREITDLKGKRTESQDIPLKTAAPPETVMAAAAALILGGVPVSFLGGILEAAAP